MRVLVIGATGGTGRELVRQATEQGHEVTAFARDPSPLAGNGVRTIAGDALDREAIARAVAGQDAVACVIGRPAGKAGRTRSAGTANLVAAMQRSGARRLVCLSTIGIGETSGMLPPLYRYVLVPTLLRSTFAEHARQEDVVRRSGLEWTIVRAGVLEDGPRTGAYHHGFPATDRSRAIKIARADVADFILGELGSPRYERATTSLSY